MLNFQGVPFFNNIINPYPSRRFQTFYCSTTEVLVGLLLLKWSLRYLRGGNDRVNFHFVREKFEKITS